MTFLRHLPTKMFLHPKCSHSPPEIFPFSTRNFTIPYIFLVIYRKKLLSIQALLKRNFHQKLSVDFLVIIYQTKISLHPIFWENVLVSGFSYILTVSLVLFLQKSSR